MGINFFKVLFVVLMLSVSQFSFAGIVEEFLEENDINGLKEYVDRHFYSLSLEETELAHKVIVNDYLKEKKLIGLAKYVKRHVSPYSPSYEVAFIAIINYYISNGNEKGLKRFLNKFRIPTDSGVYTYVKHARGFLAHQFDSVSNCASHSSGVQSIDLEISKVNQFWHWYKNILLTFKVSDEDKLYVTDDLDYLDDSEDAQRMFLDSSNFFNY